MIFGSKNGNATAEWRQWQNNELETLYKEKNFKNIKRGKLRGAQWDIKTCY